MELPNTDNVPNGNLPPFVVGIGASAGGLEALERFFENVPEDSGMAFVVVQHLSPEFKSLMNEILARRTRLPILLVEDGMAVERDHVYLLPPKKEMIIAGGRLLLGDKPQSTDLSLPIDVFFRSMAEDCGARSAAIVLSGGGSDGSRGIRAVYEAGGLVIVQDTESAQFSGMPQTAQDVGVAHHVLPPEAMPRMLAERLKHPGPLVVDEDSKLLGMGAVYRMLEQQFGIDFTHYKPSTVTRRIERRLSLARAENIEVYVERLREERDELDTLYRDLLIGVTRFFRNDAAFQVLEERVLPELLRQMPQTSPLRVWIAGCATGEEVYSLAILIHELLAKVGERPVKIFATDVHRGSIEIAMRGLYDEQAVANVSPERLRRYFSRHGSHYQVVPEIRQMAVFATHNVIKDAPFTRVDFISCRNMLIYLQPAIQRKVLNHFQFALNRQGVLFLGPSESPGPLVVDFDTIDKHWRIYRKLGELRTRENLRFRAPSKPLIARGGGSTALAAQSPLTRYSTSRLLELYDALLDDALPPSLLVNSAGELIHSFNGASRFLKVRDGRQALDVLEMVHAELKSAIAGALSHARTQRKPIAFRGVRIDGPDGEASYDVIARQVIVADNSAGAPLLISFEKSHDRPADRGEAALEIQNASQGQVSALEAELAYTRENLQAASEELETSNEELQAANEELLAANEELQSTNEELQSVNEELYSVNAEYQRKISDLTELGNDMENLLASTDVGTIFLDRQLRIRKFTPQIAELFNLLPQDVGRPISGFSNRIDYPSLTEDLQRVLESGVPIEREVRDLSDRPSFLRLLPYRAKGAVDGVVVTLIDVSGLRAMEDALFHERHLLNSLLSGVPDAIYFKDARGRFIRANDAMARRLGLADAREAVGKLGWELPGRGESQELHRQDERVLSSGEAQHYVVEERVDEKGQTRWDVVSRLLLHDAANRVVGVIGIFRDVTERRRAEMEIQEAVRRRDQFLAMLSHELRNPLGAVVAATSLLRDAPAAARDKLLNILSRQTTQMARLLDDLLEVSRVTQDKIELRKRDIDVTLVLKDAADAGREQIEARGLRFQSEIEPGPLMVDGDPARLQQVFANLLGNAAKYTPRGGHVRLHARREGHEAVISVKDNGVGMPKDFVTKVFDLFVQSNRTLARSDGGLGVGLTLVRGLVNSHGGTVTAHSAGEGKGSEFVVRLPLLRAPTRPSQRPDGGRPALRAIEDVLIVEDNADSCELLCEILTASGFHCHAAHDGLTGLARFEDAPPDVALVDIGLPGLDGLEFARRVRAKREYDGVYLIALTGYGQKQDRERAIEAGFDQHLVKPISPALLLRLLGKPSAVPSVEAEAEAEAGDS